MQGRKYIMVFKNTHTHTHYLDLSEPFRVKTVVKESVSVPTTLSDLHPANSSQEGLQDIV